MSLIVIIGAQAVGKMTVGKELEKRINGKLLFNHQTIDLYANFLGYNEFTFHLSDMTRKELFKAFVKNKGNNETETIIFTVLIDFNQTDDVDFLHDISNIFLDENEDVYFIELDADLKERLVRNVHEKRLEAKPSKRDIEFSTSELKYSADNQRLETFDNELASLFPNIQSLKINNTNLSPTEVVDKIIHRFNFKEIK